MNQIDLFQFRDLVGPVRSLAVVGNAPTILEHENGGTIDGHDVVIRFNRAQTAGMESKIGSRTDILVCNAGNNVAMAPPPSETVRPKCVVAFVSPAVGANTFDPKPFYQWVGEIPLLMCTAPDMIGHSTPLHTRPFTSGTYSVYVMLNLFPIESLFLTGFTMFGMSPGGAGKYYKDDRPSLGTYHDLDAEQDVLCDILRRFQGKLTTTPEVAALLAKAGYRHANGGAASRQPALGKRVAGGLSWRLLRWGIRLRRYSEA